MLCTQSKLCDDAEKGLNMREVIREKCLKRGSDTEIMKQTSKQRWEESNSVI